MFSCWKENCSKDADVKNVYMLATTVSSKILRAIALKEGFHFEVRVGFNHAILQSKNLIAVFFLFSLSALHLQFYEMKNRKITSSLLAGTVSASQYAENALLT